LLFRATSRNQGRYSACAWVWGKSLNPDSITGNLLIVDDDEAVTQTFARMLTLEGHDVRTANSAEDGLRTAAMSRLDAIILDMRMPLINGLGFLYRLRAREGDDHHTPVVIVTGDYALQDDIAAELRLLGAEVRFKPLWLEDLVDLARSLLRAARDNQQPPLLAS
jgi:two-component system nitrogen regulation response regulator GlnG